MHILKTHRLGAHRLVALAGPARYRLSAPLIALLIILMLPSTAPAACVATDPRLLQGTGAWIDPGGVRQALMHHGVEVGGTYIGEVLGNPSGGIKQGTKYDGLLQLYLIADMQKLGFWKGLCFHADAYQIHGQSITAEDVGSIASISNIEAFPSTRLFEFWLEQSLFGGKLSVRFGQLAADAEFLITESGGAFIDSTFGWPTLPSNDIPFGGPIYPFATPGVRVAVSPTDDLTLMVAVYNGNPIGPCPQNLDPGQCNENGLEFRLEDPPLLLAEADYAYNQNKKLPGTIKLGGWRHFGKFDDQRLDVNGGLRGVTLLDPLQLDGDYGIYAVIDQMIYRFSGQGYARGISLFARVVGSPSDRNQIDAYADGGVVVTGIMPSRPKDMLGIGFAYTHISDQVSAFDRDSGLAVIRNYEALLEISYTAEIRPGWTLQPDVQYVWNPGGNVPDNTGMRAIKNATVVGMRTTLAF